MIRGTLSSRRYFSWEPSMSLATNFLPLRALLILSLSALTSLAPVEATAQQCTSATGSGLCPGQPPPRIDLATMCFNTGTVGVVSFSMTYVSSNPNGAACAFFDTDSDGNANYAACTRSDGSQEAFFSCADTKTSSCPSFSTISAPSFSCTQSASVVSCSINVADFPTGSGVLSNVCSYTSNDGVDPNGVCKDCVNQGAQIRITKLATDKNGALVPAGSAPSFDFMVSSSGGVKSAGILGSGTAQVAVATGTYSVSENLPQDWSFSSATCTNNSGTPVGTPTSSGLSNITLSSGEAALCTFSNIEDDPALIRACPQIRIAR